MKKITEVEEGEKERGKEKRRRKGEGKKEPQRPLRDSGSQTALRPVRVI